MCPLSYILPSWYLVQGLKEVPFSVFAQILLEHLQEVAHKLRTNSKYSSKMADFLPMSIASVQNCGALLPLRHPVEVERSYPLTQCYLTCVPAKGAEESCAKRLKAGTIP